ncbi:MAG: hypothetical protein AB2L13_21125 [Spirochaetota bacterium]
MNKMTYLMVMLFTVLVLMPGCASMPNKITTSWQDDGLKGNVKTITRTSAIFSHGNTDRKIAGKHQLDKISTYDTGGNKIEEKLFTDLAPNRDFHYKYDIKGYMIEKEEIHKVSRPYNGYKIKYHYKYNSKGNVAEEVCYKLMLGMPDHWEYSKDDHNKYKYDKRGYMVEKLRGDFTTKIKYDSSGRKTDVRTYSSGREVGVSTNEYDANGNLIKSVNISTFNLENIIFSYKFDAGGNKIEESRIIEDIKLRPSSSPYHEKTTWKYDARGNMIEEIKYEDNIEKDKTILVPVEITTVAYEFY